MANPKPTPEQREKARLRSARWLAKQGNREKQKARAARILATPEGRAAQLAAELRWRSSPEGKAKKRDAQRRRDATPEGREVRRFDSARLRAIRAGAPVVDLTKTEWRDVLDESDHRCAYCGRAGRLTQDHIWPLARGGSHTRDNVAPACLPCNDSKSDNLLAEWYGFVTR